MRTLSISIVAATLVAIALIPVAAVIVRGLATVRALLVG